MTAGSSKLASGLLACSMLAACSHTGPEPARVQSADRIYLNANVITMDDDNPSASAVAIADNRIVYVGDDAGAAAFTASDTQVTDLMGRTIMPGFISAHDHLISADWVNYGVQLYDANSLEEVLSLVAEYAESHPDDPIIRGIGWNAAHYGRYPTAVELDTVVPDRPAILLDYTIHDGWLNTAAMRAAGIDRDSPDIQPGTVEWVRNAEGDPTGVGVETQWLGAFLAMGAWDPENMMRDSTRRMFALAASNGTTALQDAGILTPNLLDAEGLKRDFEQALEMLAELDRAGDLLLRAQPMLMLKAEDADAVDYAKFTAAMAQRYDSDRLRVRALKIHTSSNTAPHLEPYEDGTNGQFGVPPEKIKLAVLTANRLGIDVVTHTWSDAEIRAALDAIEASRADGSTDSRNSLHHLAFLHPDDYPRVVNGKVPVNVTPVFTTDWSGQDEKYLQELGADRVNAEINLYPWLAEAGVNVSLSADTPSAPPEMQGPLFNVQGAVTLRTPGDPDSVPIPPGRQGMSVQQALRAITIDAAWQLRMEDKIGSLEAGKYADLVILDASPFEVAPDAIAEINVLATTMDGRFTFCSPVLAEVLPLLRCGAGGGR